MTNPSHLPIIRPEKLFNLPTPSASGLVRVDECFYIISDDNHSLLKITAAGELKSIPILPGELPREYGERKKQKPDFECLFVLGDRLIGLGSGSRENRTQGFSISTDASTNELSPPSLFSLAPLYDALAKKIPGLNIEGALALRNEIWLFQRGNTEGSFSGVIRLDADVFQRALDTAISSESIREIHDLSSSLPEGYGFTDASAVATAVVTAANGLWFLAVREETKDAYDDGAFAGAILGQLLLSDDGTPEIGRLALLEIEAKPEGLWVESAPDGGFFAYLVTDADSSDIPSAFYRFALPS